MGIAGFMAVGAYGYAISVLSFGLEWWLAALIGLVASALFALILGIPTLRLRGDYLAIVTIAAAEVVRLMFLTSAFDDVTGSADGLSGYHASFRASNPIPEGTYGFGPWTYNETDWWVRITGLITLAFAVLVVWMLMRSPWGRSLKGIREDEDAVRALGKNVYAYKMQSLVLGGVLAGAGGIVYALPSAVSPGVYVTSLTFFVWTALLLGGAATVFGPLLGSLIFWGLQTFLSNFLPALVQAGFLPFMIDDPGRHAAIHPGGCRAHAARDLHAPGSARKQEGADLCQVTARPTRARYRWNTTRRRPSSAPRRPACTSARRFPGVAKVDPIIVADNVSRSFGGVNAVDVEHLEIPRGVITALIGPNGAGKTTLFNLLTGFDKPNTGTWTFDGKSLSGVPAYRVARMGQVRTFQLTKALGLLTVLENMKLGATGQRGERFFASMIPALWRKQDKEIEERAMILLAKFKLDTKANDFAASLSGGQRKLLEMARALMTQPKLVMLDEPMAGVNPALTQSLLDHILDLKEEGMTVLFVEHDMHMVRHIADWVVVMAEGRIVAEGDPYTVMRNPAVIDAYLGAHQELDLGVVTGRISVVDADPTTDAAASTAVTAEDLEAAGQQELDQEEPK